MGLIQKIFGTHSENELKRIYPIVDQIEALDSQMQALSDEELRGKTKEFKQRLNEGETLDDILPEAYATVREAAYRSLGMKHYRVQLIGGIILHQGRIAEMRTGEGKTLVSTLPAYLNALSGKGVHIVTVNDYLARRDAEWMGKVHQFLGLTVGVVLNSMESEERRAAYDCDITYVTNNELGFDYLRDNMVIYKEQLVQRGLNFAVIDEVDSVLIDEARTPLIISGQSSKSTKLYEACDILARQLERGEASGEFSKINAIMGEDIEETGDYIVNEKEKSVNLTEDGVKKVEKFFHIENLADPENLEIQHNIILALRAHNLMFRDQDYVVTPEGEVVIVDEFTGRIMPGRRYSDGLHQAIEAKEHVKVMRESKTLATITFQNLFNKYEKKSGMTGTALTEEKEFRDIYGMDVIEIPTNLPVQRKDLDDAVYKTKEEKYKAVVEAVKEAHATGQPVLVGTITIDVSELLSKMLKKEGIPHNVLNAKYHEQEAEIVANAGIHGAVTIATNMAGRGTDIKLDDESKAAGGLKIIGTERHESRRIDNQLRGRAGRQGDPGSSQFFVSLEDDLMRLFGGDRMQAIVQRLGVEEDEAIESGVVTRQIENAQKKVEGKNFSIRKYVLQYDNVMNKQREIIYGERHKVLLGENLKGYIRNMTEELVCGVIDPVVIASKHPGDWDLDEMNRGLKRICDRYVPVEFTEEEQYSLTEEELKEQVMAQFDKLYEEKEAEIGEEKMRELERMILIRVVDNQWMDHIDAMDQLRTGIGLRGLGQQDPAAAYAQEGFAMFEMMIGDIKEQTVKFCYNVTEQTRTERRNVIGAGKESKAEFDGSAPAKAAAPDMPQQTAVPDRNQGKKPQTYRRTEEKVGRNDPCPCGSGKKYKNCCMNKQEQ